MSMQEAFVTVMGLRTHYFCAGNGARPVVLLHGGGTDSARLSWGEVIEPLAAAEYRIYAPDWPGYGDSDRPDIRYGSEFYLGFLGAWLDALRLPRVGLVGLSMGGCIALGAALRWPERLERLVLVDTYGIQRHVAMHKLSYLMVRLPGVMEASWALARASRAMARASLGNVLHDVQAAPPALLDEVLAEARRPGAGRAFTSYQRDEVSWGGLRTVYIDRLHEIKAPTLLVHGRQDAAVPLACAEEAHRLIAGSRLAVIDGAGHWPQRERPAEFLRVLTDFLDKTGGQ